MVRVIHRAAGSLISAENGAPPLRGAHAIAYLPAEILESPETIPLVFFWRPGNIHLYGSAVVLVSVHRASRVFCFLLAGHLDESESLFLK